MKNKSILTLLTIAVSGILLLPGCFQDKSTTDSSALEQPSIEQVEVQEIVLQDDAPQQVAQQEIAQQEIAQQEVAVQERQTNVAGKSIALTDLVSRSSDAVRVLRDIASKGNVVIDFYAHWCGPCKFMSPIIDALAVERPNITFIKVDIDKFDDISEGFELAGKQIHVGSIPTFYLLKGGVIVDQLNGGMQKEIFAKSLDTHFGK